MTMSFRTAFLTEPGQRLLLQLDRDDGTSRPARDAAAFAELEQLD